MTEPRIAIVGSLEDDTARAIYERLLARGHDPYVLDAQAFPEDMSVSLGARLDDVAIAGKHFPTPSAVYVRSLYQSPASFGADAESAMREDWRRTMAAYRERSTVLSSVLLRWEASGAAMYNPLSASWRITKPYQLALLESAGLPVPDTLWSNDPEAVVQFCRERDAIYKPVAGGAATRRVTPDVLTPQRLSRLAAAPVCFQEYLPGDDVRVYVIDGKVVCALRIVTDAVDFRQNEQSIEPVTLSDEVEEQCIRAARLLGLRYTGMDIKGARDGRYKILELNPSAMFLGFESLAGVDIGGPLCEALLQHTTRRGGRPEVHTTTPEPLVERPVVAERAEATQERQIFREAALAAHRGGGRPGRPLNIVSAATHWAIRVTVAIVFSCLVFSATARVGEYAEGPAVVRLEGRTVVTSAVSGTVQAVELELGQHVTTGEVLVRLDDATERAELESVERERQQRLVEFLRRPSDASGRERLASLDAQQQAAVARVRAREIRAPADAVVSDIRIRVGQPVAPGDAIVSLERDAAQTVVVGLFPGHYRPLLANADPRLELELQGFPDSRVEVEVRSVADEVIGPAEAMRYLGPDREGALSLDGPVVVVETVLPDGTFVADDTEYRVFDGMQGTVEAKIRSATLLETIVPALRRL